MIMGVKRGAMRSMASKSCCNGRIE